MSKEWKIDNWWMKTIWVLAAIFSIYMAIIFIIGFISGVVLY